MENFKSKIEKYIKKEKPAWTPAIRSILNVVASNNGLDVLTIYVKKDFAGKRLASKDGLELLCKCFIGESVGIILVRPIDSLVRELPQANA